MKDNKFFLIPILLLLELVLLSCTLESKTRAIKSLEHLVQEAESKSNIYSDSEWNAIEEKYLIIYEERLALYDQEFTPIERRKINQLIGKYNALKVKRELKNIKNGIIDITEQTKSFIDELAEGDGSIRE